ncbi:GtrA family protein [Enterobacter ludwigii]|uniref:GtrA family protein n=1 Tax=Enterobacter TaxID=547 RepID=UPI00068178BC|nr:MULTISPECIES: GtrA family protein [Enterobacter]EKS7212114.1 GtrA family protein [Enterobacter ludwigii]MBO1467560.1 GtrA family protein [Enterobacter ludwigii]MBO1525441.1 GtrA family protein [Enterobacter ludwigii]MBQ0308934.1 GtrA family protein [Enterobacter ludwigii]MCE2009661.1 GtrA family protein [Enterobacter ludwigii]
MMKVLRELFFFAISGGLGFLVDTAVLYLLIGSLGPYIARGLSFFSAVLFTWIFNRSITFKGKRSNMKAGSEFVSYLLLMLCGGAVNYGLYSWLISSYGIVLEHPIIGVAAGSIAGMFVNLATSKLILFRKEVND